MDNTEKPKFKEPKAVTTKTVQPKDKISDDQIYTLRGMLTPEREPKLLDYFKVEKIEDLTAHDFIEALAILSSAKK